MTKETKTEIVAVTGLALIALVFLLLHRQPAVAAAQPPAYGDGLGVGGTDATAPLSDTSLAPVAPNGPATYNIGGNGGLTIPSSGGACGCNTCSQSGGYGVTFGSSQDLANYLAAAGITPTTEQINTWN